MSEKEQVPQKEQAAQQGTPQIIIRSQYVKDFSFENPNAPTMLTSTEGQPEIEINIGVSVNPQKEERLFESLLSINATGKRNNETMFVAELTYAALVSVDPSVEEKILHPLMMIEAPRMMFPFARQIMADMTQAGGFMPLNIQPIDFVRVYQAGQQARAANQSKSAGGGNEDLNIDNVLSDKKDNSANADGKKKKDNAKKKKN